MCDMVKIVEAERWSGRSSELKLGCRSGDRMGAEGGTMGQFLAMMHCVVQKAGTAPDTVTCGDRYITACKVSAGISPTQSGMRRD